MANGFLTGKYTKDAKFESCLDYRSLMPQFSAEGVEQNRQLLEAIQAMAEQKGATPAQLSLAWMMCKQPAIVPIPGSRNPDRMRENAAADILLSPAEVANLDKLLDRLPKSEVLGGTKRS